MGGDITTMQRQGAQTYRQSPPEEDLFHLAPLKEIQVRDFILRDQVRQFGRSYSTGMLGLALIGWEHRCWLYSPGSRCG